RLLLWGGLHHCRLLPRSRRKHRVCHGFRVLLIRLDRCNHHTRFDLQDLDAEHRNARPDVNHDALIQDAIDELEQHASALSWARPLYLSARWPSYGCAHSTLFLPSFLPWFLQSLRPSHVPVSCGTRAIPYTCLPHGCAHLAINWASSGLVV